MGPSLRVYGVECVGGSREGRKVGLGGWVGMYMNDPPQHALHKGTLAEHNRTKGRSTDQHVSAFTHPHLPGTETTLCAGFFVPLSMTTNSWKPSLTG